jgi:hypothetical protein
LRQLNDERLIRRLGVTRRGLFEELDRPNLNSLPGQPYCFAEWRVRRVDVDSPHISVQLVPCYVSASAKAAKATKQARRYLQREARV